MRVHIYPRDWHESTYTHEDIEQFVETRIWRTMRKELPMNDEKKRQKPLSEAAARSCEEARGPTCHCRCGGSMHGGKRGGSQYGKQTDGTFLDTPREFFEQLPEDDPHYLLDAEAKVRRARERKEEKRREHQEMMERRWTRIAEMEASAPRGIFW